jgi:O-antigen/teichoic acid export membrane protein
MTWSSFATRSLSFVFVLPLLLRNFGSSELAVWYIFATLASLQILAEIGFGATFVRFVAYSHSHTEHETVSTQVHITDAGSKNLPLAEVIGTMNKLYWGLTILLAVSLAIGGTLALQKPLKDISNRAAGWTAWAIVFGSTLVAFRGNFYSTWLQGTNQIATLRRWETLISIASIASSIVVLKTGNGLLPLVAANQFWACVGVVTTGFLAHSAYHGQLRTLCRGPFSRPVFHVVWPSAWRSALGVFMSQGVTQISGLVYAQVGASRDVAMYLLAVRLQQTLASMANAPFYSKIPTLARLWSAGDKGAIVQIARKAMSMTLWAFILPIAFLGLFGPLIFKLLESKTPFPSNMIWGLMAAAGLVERYGAMHLQLFSLSNTIVWHIANGVTGIIFVVTAAFLFPILHAPAIPLAMLCANLGFYAWYCSRLSHQLFDLDFRGFDLATVTGPAFFLLCYIVAIASKLI